MKAIPSRIFGVLLVVLLSFSSLAVVNVKAQEENTIMIQPDGTIQGTDKIQKNNNIYTLTSDITCSKDMAETLIFILKDNIILDGNSYTISSNGNGIGIHLRGRQNVTIKNLNIIDFGTGIGFGFSKDYPTREAVRLTAKNNKIINNHITSYYWGIELTNTDTTIISDNSFTSTNPQYGVSLGNSNNIQFYNNKLYGGSLKIDTLTNYQIFDNTINDKPLIVLQGESNKIIDGAGQVILIDCFNMQIKNVNPATDQRETIQLMSTNNSQITKCTGRITLSNSHYNIISNNDLSKITSISFPSQSVIVLSTSNFNLIYENQITECDNEAISLTGSDFNYIFKNSISKCNSGIWLLGSNNNSIFQNNIENSNFGIKLAFQQFVSIPPYCYNNSIYENTISSCTQGIHLFSADENKIYRNNISNSSEYGVFLCFADSNTFYNNNFLYNENQIYEEHYWFSGLEHIEYFSENNTWNAILPTGGNFWSDYIGEDNNGDGFGDNPHIIFENMTDYYPLISAITITNSPLPDFPTPPPTPSPTTTPTLSPTPTPTPSPSPSPESESEFPTTQILSLALTVIIGLAILAYSMKKRRAR